jgi:Na+-transporting methylmalonyl-CoA/oxaloacetate decarboxylase gamma subunit
MLGEALILGTIGIIYVFAVMALIIVLILVIKLVSKPPPSKTMQAPKEEVKPVKEEELSGEEKAIIAAITSYLILPGIEKTSIGESRVESSLWSLAGRMELMSLSSRREEKWGEGSRLVLEKRRLL